MNHSVTQSKVDNNDRNISGKNMQEKQINKRKWGIRYVSGSKNNGEVDEFKIGKIWRLSIKPLMQKRKL